MSAAQRVTPIVHAVPDLGPYSVTLEQSPEGVSVVLREVDDIGQTSLVFTPEMAREVGLQLLRRANTAESLEELMDSRVIELASLR